MNTPETRKVMCCPGHAPLLPFDQLPNDDGNERCSVDGCRVRGYHVKPFVLTGNSAAGGWWRDKSGQRVEMRTS